MPSFIFHAPCPFGLEGLLADEIRALNADPDLIRSAKGSVSFAGGLELGMAVCLHSRFATRVLLRVAFDEYWDSRDVYALAKKTPWEKWFGTDTTFRIHSSANRCPLESLDFATLRIKDGLCDRFTELVGRRPSVEKRSPDVRIEAYFTFDHVSFYIDLAGESLFKRGWRLEHGEAPLKENLAAALLALSGWKPELPLVDPFCGSGTIAIEAAAMATNTAPGLMRRFAFERLQGFDMALWQEMKEDARAAQNRSAKVFIRASDISTIVVEKAEENCRRAGFGALLDDGRIVFHQGDARSIKAPEGAEGGLVIANPPYGEQSNPKSASIAAMMADFAAALKSQFPGWTAWLLTSDRLLPRQMRLKESRKIVLFNGPLECRFFRFDMVAGSNRRKTGETLSQAQDG